MEDFVSYELAKKLKEKGFDNECFAYYTNDATLYHNYPYEVAVYSKGCYLSHNLMTKDSVDSKFIDAPTISQVLKWLREEKKIDCGAMWDNIGVSYMFYVIEMDMPDLSGTYPSKEDFDSYEQAALAGIEYVLDNLP